MASKRKYWKCVDCGSEVNDDNMREVAHGVFAEVCYGCINYNPEVVIAYR